MRRWVTYAVWVVLYIAVFTGTATLQAQDTRNVVEPHLPPVCTVLMAQLSAPGGVLPEVSERTPDTTRIQEAIDHCPPGRAVELKAAASKNIFLSGPLLLRSGVTLLVDANTALFASRNPRDYDLTAGSWGVVNEKGHGCKPWILAENAPASGIMGDGVLDGRGGAKLLGQDLTWWDLAHTAKVFDKQQSVPRMRGVAGMCSLHACDCRRPFHNFGFAWNLGFV